MKFTCVDSFSGAGGLTLGLVEAGYDVLLSFDIDKKCIDTIQKNQKYVPHLALNEDIHNMLNGRLLDIIKLQQGELFLLAGGPPCQGFSIQRIGDDADSRNDLVLLYGKLVDEVRPCFFLMENVSGIQGKRGKEILSSLITNMEEVGYKVHRKMINAEEYGVPQRRKRIFLVGERNDIGSSYEFPEPTNIRYTVKDTIGYLPPTPNDGKPHPDYPLHRRDQLSEKNLQRIRAIQQGQGRDYLPKELLADCHKVDSAVIGHRNVYGRMSWDEVAPTITARFDSFTRGQFGHPEQARSISLLEGALLQTFPNDYIFTGSKVEIARQIGNAVPPRLSKVIGDSIISYYLGRGE